MWGAPQCPDVLPNIKSITPTRAQMKYSNMRARQRLPLIHHHTIVPFCQPHYSSITVPTATTTTASVVFQYFHPTLVFLEGILQNRYLSYFFSSTTVSCATFHLLIDDKDDFWRGAALSLAFPLE